MRASSRTGSAATPGECPGDPFPPEGAGAGSSIVLKFGGTSLGTPQRVRRAAKRVRRHVRAGSAVVVVVSAAGRRTDRILRWLHAVGPEGDPRTAREVDRALATGEDLSAATLAAALLALGVPAVSLRGGEAGLEAGGAFGAGRIERLDDTRLRALLRRGVVPVVSGFQARRPDGETVTLGRGGSDTTAVYLAGTLGADACHIVTDVDGVYDRDPRRDPGARRFSHLPHEALLSIVDAGAQVVHPAAARYAQQFGTPLHVYSYLRHGASEGGTFVGPVGAPPGVGVSRAGSPLPAPAEAATVEPGSSLAGSSGAGAPQARSPLAHERGETGRCGVSAAPIASGAGEAAPGTRARVLRVALAGCGVVGGELVRLIQTYGRAIETGQGVRLELASVLVRDPGKERAVRLAPALYTRDVDDFLRAPADVVVEAMGGLDPAERIARAVLGRGARFVTANKALVGVAGDDLAAIARERAGTIDFEAAVGGGIPVVRALRDALAEGQGPIRRIRAILNGTTNYVLTLLERGIPFESALRSAQRSGFAEADPTRDLDGTDAADKLRILAWIAYGIAPRALRVRTRGILPDPDRLTRDAEALGGAVRLLAECALVPGGVAASVEPVIVPPGGELGRTVEEQNHISVDLGWSRPVSLSGPGAGGLPTASALLGDILRSCAVHPPPGVREVAPCEEEAPHSWLLSVDRRGAGAEVLETLVLAGVDAERLRTEDSSARFLLGPCGWPGLGEALQGLERAGLSPLITRLAPELDPGSALVDAPLVCALLARPEVGA